MMLRPVAAAVLLLGAGACAANRVGDASRPGVPAPGRVVYETEVHIDTVAGTLEARSALRFVADSATASEVGLLLNRGLAVRAVRGTAVRSYRTAPFDGDSSWNLVTVALNGVSQGSVVAVELEYGGKPLFPPDGINRIAPDWVELSLDSQWHPVFSSFDREMTGVLRVSLPAGWTVVASGPASLANGVHVVRNTVPQVDAAFAAAPSFARTEAGGVTVYARGAAPGVVAAVRQAAQACGRYLDRRYGTRDPLPEVKLVLAARTGPGYARKNYIVLSRVDPADSVGLHMYLCHELAHYWTPAGGAFSPHHWMMEAFAEYVAARYVRQRFGPAAFEGVVARWRPAAERAGPVWTPESTRRPSGPAMYRRAPLLLSRLEARIGSEGFDRLLAAYMAGQVLTTPELLDRLRDVAGADVEQWFRGELAAGPVR